MKMIITASMARTTAAAADEGRGIILFVGPSGNGNGNDNDNEN